MTRYLLDTDIVSCLVRDPQGPVTARIREVGETQVRTSIIVAAELRYGATQRASAPLTRQIEAVLGALEILHLEPPADAIYGEIRAARERAGTPIGANDMLIAAQAIVSDCTLVTDNEREFAQIEGLAIENWLRPK